MKKEDFVKIGIAEELAVKCEAASLEELKGYIPRARLNEVSEENKSLKQAAADRDRQLEELKKFGGDNAELKKQLEALQQQNAEQRRTHEAELARLRLDNAVETALAAAGAKNVKAVRSLLDFAKLKLDAEGRVDGLEEQIGAVKSSDPYMFTEKEASFPVLRGFQPGASSDFMPDGKADLSQMTYSEMTAFLSQNPDAKMI